MYPLQRILIFLILTPLVIGLFSVPYFGRQTYNNMRLSANSRLNRLWGYIILFVFVYGLYAISVYLSLHLPVYVPFESYHSIIHGNYFYIWVLPYELFILLEPLEQMMSYILAFVTFIGFIFVYYFYESKKNMYVLKSFMYMISTTLMMFIFQMLYLLIDEYIGFPPSPSTISHLGMIIFKRF